MLPKIRRIHLVLTLNLPMHSIKTRKILFLASWYPESAVSRNGLFIWSHAEALAENEGYQVDLMAVYSSKQAQSTISTNKLNQVNHWVVQYPEGSNSLRQAWRYWRSWGKLYKAYTQQNGRPDWAVVNVLWRAGLWAWWLKMRYNLPYIIIEHWSAYLPDSKRIIGFVEKYLSKLIADEAEIVLPVSAALEKGMRKRYLGRKFQLLPNIIDTEIFYPPVAERTHAAPILIHVSNLAEVKNFDFVLSVFEALKIQYPNCRLWVAGAYSEAACMPYAAFPEIEWLGLLDKGDLAAYYRQADFLLLPSHQETFSIVVGEALACGCAVLTAPLSGLSHYQHLSNRHERPLSIDLWINCISQNWQHKKAADWESIDKTYSKSIVSKKIIGIISKLKP